MFVKRIDHRTGDSAHHSCYGYILHNSLGPDGNSVSLWDEIFIGIVLCDFTRRLPDERNDIVVGNQSVSEKGIKSLQADLLWPFPLTTSMAETPYSAIRRNGLAFRQAFGPQDCPASLVKFKTNDEGWAPTAEWKVKSYRLATYR